ncbi:hypothetical protein [Mesorhizobium sp. AA22]|uniref:hypothetical protein n=1 Tax=Mesorhizobium sp. AA22 TaxID=1854057 RepID=UPI0007EC46F3|nr:hypothetical protein [Mesorhizobium sp. AA22]QIA23281.1 hypothetical protein A9K68_017005 [Mesorhizobium sp. AA22]
MSVLQKTPAEPELDRAERLLILFDGERTRHGTYDPTRLRLVGDKVEMKDERGQGPRDVSGPPTIDLWRRHVSGELPLGVRPVGDDGRCRWGVVDVDSYGVDHADLVARVEAERLPLVAFRSKSGGAHLFLFLSEWSSQAAVNTALRAMTVRLDLPADTEVYPPASGEGNWLNMPYFGGDETDRYAVKKGGLVMSLSEFLHSAERSRMSAGDLGRLSKPTRRADRASTGEGKAGRAARDLGRYSAELASKRQGGRATLLYGRAKDMGKMIGAGWIHEDTVWSRLLRAATAESVDPLPYGEASGHIKRGIEDGKKEPPPEDDNRYPVVESIVIWRGGEETLWEITLAGHGTVTLPVKEAMHYWTFNVRCADKLRTSFRQMKADAWNDQIAVALAVAKEREIPPDETVEGMFRDGLREFCMHRHRGDSIEDLMLGKPAHVDDDRRIYFRFEDFHRFLDRKQSGPFRSTKRQVLGRLLAGIGGEGVDHGKTTKKLKGVTTEVRWIRSDLFESIEPFRRQDLPPIPGEGF